VKLLGVVLLGLVNWAWSAGTSEEPLGVSGLVRSTGRGHAGTGESSTGRGLLGLVRFHWAWLYCRDWVRLHWVWSGTGESSTGCGPTAGRTGVRRPVETGD